MIMMGLEFTGEVPFQYVYLHGLVRDENSRKMSKSLGNVIDPLELMSEFGTDALRFTLLTGATPGNDMSLSVKKVEANRNFANKLWNAARLVISSIEGAPTEVAEVPDETLADRWIVARLTKLKQDVNRLFAAYQYGEAGRQLYEFFWGEFADWYLEVAKLQIRSSQEQYWMTVKKMVMVLDETLRMLHPYIPFVTEEIWTHLKAACKEHPAAFGPETPWEDALMVAKWPEVGDEDIDIVSIKNFTTIMDLIRSIRNIRSEKKVEAGLKIICQIQAGEQTGLVQEARSAIATLAHLDPDRFEIVEALEERPVDAIPLVVGSIEAFLPLSGMVDREADLLRISKEIENVQNQIERLRILLDSPFSTRAPEEVVTKEKEKLQDLEETFQKLQSQRESLL
jgi:valyl-tRNA synthetase